MSVMTAEAGQEEAGHDTNEANESGRVELLVEYADSRGLQPQVDSQAGVITGVKLLGLESRNGRMYRPAAITEAAALYEGVKVNVDHPRGRAAARAYRDRLGCIRNVRAAADGLFGDLHFNPHHPIAGQLAWDAQWAPENVGLSHNVRARTSRRRGETLVQEILQVHSVDLVADPATTSSLFESAGEGEDHDDEAVLHEAKQQILRRRQRLHGWIHEARLPAEAVTAEFVEGLLELEEDAARALIHERVRFFNALARSPSGPKSKGPTPETAAPPDSRRWARMIT